jgi:hypothetical protein
MQAGIQREASALYGDSPRTDPEGARLTALADRR